MNSETFRRKRVAIPALCTVAALAIGGTAWAASAHDDDIDERSPSRSAATSAEKAALAAIGTGTVTEVETSDDPGTAYEVEVRTARGVEWDVDLDAKFAVVSKTKDD
jgi:uncharacterized membrane protein YkoI